MDSVVERIVSAKLGPKWKLLYSRLSLDVGARARDRYRIETAHSAEKTEERYASCVRDTINRWKSTVAIGMDEREAIRQLLCALERVQGFEGVAREIASESGTVCASSTVQVSYSVATCMVSLGIDNIICCRQKSHLD